MFDRHQVSWQRWDKVWFPCRLRLGASTRSQRHQTFLKADTQSCTRQRQVWRHSLAEGVRVRGQIEGHAARVSGILRYYYYYYRKTLSGWCPVEECKACRGERSVSIRGLSERKLWHPGNKHVDFFCQHVKSVDAPLNNVLQLLMTATWMGNTKLTYSLLKSWRKSQHTRTDGLLFEKKRFMSCDGP